MVFIFGSLFLGSLIGFALRHHHLHRLLDRLTRAIIPLLALLLFCMGYSTARSPVISQHFLPILFSALMLALGGVIGSLLFGPMVQHLLGPCLKRREAYFKKERRQAISWGESHPEMKSPPVGRSLIMAFSLGALLGYLAVPLKADAWRDWVGPLLMLVIGVSIGSDRRTWNLIRRYGATALILPLAILSGTAIGTIAIAYWIPNLPLLKAIGIGSGLGYYSMTSLIVGKASGPALGFLALMVNLMRELLTIVFGAQLVTRLGPFAPILSGGATTFNSTLPTIVAYSGREYAVMGLINGLVLTVLVPLILGSIFGF